jgi:hypothetical protein
VPVLDPPLHLSEVSRGVDPPRQFTFCCSTCFSLLLHSVLRDPNDPASGNGLNRASDLVAAFPLWERSSVNFARNTFSSSEVMRCKTEHSLWKCIQYNNIS